MTTSSPPTTRTPPSAGAPASRPPRLVGVDLARGLAVLGMVLVHVAAPAATAGGVGGAVFDLASGRSAAAFAVLAGVSLALMTGGRRGLAEHGAGRRSERDRLRVALRAATLFALGVGLTAVATGPVVVLSFYAVALLVLLPVLWARPAVLGLVAGAWAVAGPVVSYALRAAVSPDSFGGAVAPGDLTSWAAAAGAGERLLLTGAYPVLTCVPLVLVGLVVGRLDLAAPAVQLRLLAAGVAAALAGYGGSWLAVTVLGGEQAMLRTVAPLAPALGLTPEQALDLLAGTSFGTVPTLSPAFLVIDDAHSGTPFEVVGSAGVAVAVLATCLLFAARAGSSVGAVLGVPAAVGSLALSLYAGHLVAMAGLTAVAPQWQADPWAAALWFLVAATAVSWAWHRALGRGPLERLLHAVSATAGRRTPA